MGEKTISSKTVFDGRIMRIEVLDVLLPSGRTSVREIVRHGPAVAVITRRRSDGKFVFIHQFRKPLDRVCFEVMAGNIEPGEDPQVAAIRELKEETGYKALSIKLLSPLYPSIGYCDERIDIFYAEVEEQGETDFDQDEVIETVHLSEEEMDAKIRAGEVTDGKTLGAWALYKSMTSEK